MGNSSHLLLIVFFLLQTICFKLKLNKRFIDISCNFFCDKRRIIQTLTDTEPDVKRLAPKTTANDPLKTWNSTLRFLRADDDVYIRPDRLEDLLRSVDSKKPWFIGQTGRGNSEEFGLLSLETDENFCMGGPGVILSRETLKRMAPHVEDCLDHLYTTHEDVELGRCVRRFAGISCTWSYEASGTASKAREV